MRARELDGAFGRLTAGGEQENFFETIRRDINQQRNQLRSFLTWEAVIVNDPTVDLIADGFANGLGAMTGIGDEHTAGKIQPHVTVCIVHLHTLGAIPHHRRLAAHRDGLAIT